MVDIVRVGSEIRAESSCLFPKTAVGEQLDSSSGDDEGDLRLRREDEGVSGASYPLPSWLGAAADMMVL